ncbi:hypothetical protein Tco_0586442, partial [Tanacetum coccineum]
RTRSYQDDVSRYLNENPTPSLGDIDLPRIVGTSGLNSQGRSSVKEKLSVDSFDTYRLTKSQTVVVPEVIITKPTGPDQCGSTGVKSDMITSEENLTSMFIPEGNPELTSLISGAYEIPSDVQAPASEF